MNRLKEYLSQRLGQAPLPGRNAQIAMAPEPVSASASLRDMQAPPSADDSAVLILLFPNEQQQPELVLTLRTRSINHGGQLSFPGGRAEAEETPVDTALREAREEVGIIPADVQIIGKLSKLYVAHSHNHVTPVVGMLDYTPQLEPNPAEVAEAFSVELDSLLDKKNLTVEQWDLRDNATYRVPYWDVHRVPLWGATAMMLNEFLDLYRAFKSQDAESR